MSVDRGGVVLRWGIKNHPGKTNTASLSLTCGSSDSGLRWASSL